MREFVTFFKNLKFKQKLIFSYVVVILIPITVLGTYFYIQSKTFLQNQTKIVLNQNIKQMADNINYKFEKYNSLIESLSYNPVLFQVFNTNYTSIFKLYNDLKDNVDPLFYNVMFQNNEIDKIFIFTENNTVTKRVDSIGAIEDINKKVWYLETKKDWYLETKKDWKTNWYFEDGRLFGAHILFKQSSSDLDNMVYVGLKYDNIFRDIGDQLMDNQGLLIYDRNNNTIFYKDKTPNGKSQDTVKELISSKSDLVKLANKDYVVIKKKVPSTSWTVCFYLPVSSVSIDATKIFTATVVVMGLCLIVLVFIIWIFSTTFVKRINYLNGKMKLVAMGDMKVDISSKSKDEIGELINGFSFMLKNINSLINEVYHSKVIQKEAELKALKAQINPHFLYNSLSLINWRAISIKASDISHITTTLSKFYRTSLNKGDNIISIRDELENTKAYMEIQLIRHDYSFDAVYDIQDGVLKYDMINLILQPIVENAIEHGIDSKRGGRGKIRISGCETDSLIELVIWDNGPGMDDEQVEQILVKQSKGYGMKNVNERLKLFFGEEYGLTIKSQPEVGTSITVKMPKYIKGL